MTTHVVGHFALGMASLGKNSTVTEAIQSYRENSAYEEVNSVDMAMRYVTAIRWLLGNPKRSKQGGPGGVEDEFDTETLREEMRSARIWASGRQQNRAPTLDVDFSEFDTRA